MFYAFTNRLMCQNNFQAVENKAHFVLGIERPKLFYSPKCHHTIYLRERRMALYIKNKLEFDVTLAMNYLKLKVR